MDAQTESHSRQRSPALPIAIVVVLLGAVSAAGLFVVSGSSSSEFDPIEVAELGIRVNCICPGAIDTNFAMPPEAAFQPKPAEYLKAIGDCHPLGRPIEAEDCARAALFLASDLSSNITGVALPVDGGYVAR